MSLQQRGRGWEKDSKTSPADFEYENLVTTERKFNIKFWRDKGEREGYLYNMVTTTMSVPIPNTNKTQQKTGAHLYFVSDNSKTWRLTYFYRPYFYLKTKNIYNYEQVTKYLKKEMERYNIEIDFIKKDDLSLFDHLNKKRSYLNNILFKLSFDTLENLNGARDFLAKIVEKNKKSRKDDSLNNTGMIFNEGELSQSKMDHSQKNDYSYSYNKNDENSEKATNITSVDAKNKLNGTIENKLNMNEIIINSKKTILSKEEVLNEFEEIYEYDVKYITRLCIDKNIRCGLWYKVIREENEIYTECTYLKVLNKSVIPPLNVLAWDIECYKDELKFPDKEKDEIILISYMYNGQGYLIVNRNVMSKNIREFLYRPNNEYAGAGSFKIFNEKNEYFLLKRFLEHIRLLQIHIFVTYNGDFFDIPYLFRRCEIHNLSVPKEIGFQMNNKMECTCNFILNIDCYKWVERDSYLPNGSRTLKQVCKIKLKYNPTEVDPELMVPIARNDPQHLAVYSVSDAVATFYLYDKYIHNFLFALCSIIPMSPDDVLRQGSGTLCEQLLMAEAYNKNILFPNKSKPTYNQYFTDPTDKKKYFIYDDSFVGGTVQSLKCGIYRNDLKEHFSLDVTTYQYLVNNIDSILDFWIQRDLNKNSQPEDPQYIHKNQILNLESIRSDVCEKLNYFIKNPNIHIYPLIYHLDVAAMYPNIILSHRLQPNAIITPDHCFNCSFYKQRHICQKKMIWKRKLEISPIDLGHVLSLKQDLKSRLFIPQKAFTHKKANKEEEEDTSDEEKQELMNKKKSWNELSEKQQHDELMKAIKDYSQKVFKKTKISKETDTSSLVCQRENPFYVDTVRTFRDRRYVYKRRLKECEHEKRELLKEKKIDYIKIQELDDKILLNDSLQLAHKCILNSFYGYVKRRSSRWYSDQMGAIVTYTGSQIISGAFELIDKIGIPMELDTDGIWCMLPKHFPEIYDVFVLDKKYINQKSEYEKKSEEEWKEDPNIKKIDFEFPTNILNYEMHKKWTNHQYLVYNETIDEYQCISKNEIFFELDGPWHGMFLPASEKSDELLKKRYVVFNEKYKISELKGFEIKRRGELRIIQKFQSEIFNHFLKGKTKEEAYYYASLTANKWKNLIDSKAIDINNDDELFELILARKVLNKSVKEQPNAKSSGITTAKRLSELLNNSSYVEDNNVSTQFIVASRPIGADVTFRAIPVQVFKTNIETQVYYLSKWLDVKFPPNVPVNVRDIIDWDYYKQKLETQILKLVIIPAIKQNINNPITSIPIPDWLKKQINMSEAKQKKITSFFVKKPKEISDSANEAGASMSDASSLSTTTPPKGMNGTNDTMNQNNQMKIESNYMNNPYNRKKKRSQEEILLEYIVAKRKKIMVLSEDQVAPTKGNFKKGTSFDRLNDNINSIVINHKKIDITKLKTRDLHQYFLKSFSKWMLITNRIWKNNRMQIKSIRLEEQSKKKRISFTEETDVSANAKKMASLDSKYTHVIQNTLDIVYLYKKIKIKKNKKNKKKSETINANTKKDTKETLLKPYLPYFTYETDSDSDANSDHSGDEQDAFTNDPVLDESEDNGIYYALVSLKNMNKFYKIKLQVYRHIYINNYEPIEMKSNNNITIKLVCANTNHNDPFNAKAYANVFLPRNVKVFNLYEFIMKEKYFSRYIVNTLNANYHESIISVYETRVPLYYDFLSRYGTTVEIETNNYNSIFDEHKNFKSHCFSKVTKNNAKYPLAEYLDDVHIIHVHIFHTLVDNICNRIFVSVYDQYEDGGEDFLLGNKIMFSGVEEKDSFDPYETFVSFLQSETLKENLSKIKNKTINGSLTNGTLVNGSLTNGTLANGSLINGTMTNGTVTNEAVENTTPTSYKWKEDSEILNILFNKENFIKNVDPQFLFLYHYRKFDVHHETQTNVYKILEYLDLYLNKYRHNMLTGKKKYIFYVSSTIDKKKLGWWSTNKYFPCFFAKLEEPSKYQNVPVTNYKQEIMKRSLTLFFSQYQRIEEDMHLSRVCNIPLFNLLNVDKKFEKHKLIYDVLYAFYIKKYRGILWLSYLGNYDLGIPCLNINNFCDYDIERNAEITNPGIYRGYIVHICFNESLIFNGVRLFTKFAAINAKASADYLYVKRNSKKLLNGMTAGNIKQEEEEDDPFDDEQEEKLDNHMNLNGEENANTNNNKKNLIKNKYDINLIVEQDAHVSQFSNEAFKILGQALDYLVSKISGLRGVITKTTFENISDIFTSFYSWVSNNSSLLYDVALHNKVLECSGLYQNELIHTMKKKFNANIIYADLRNCVISFNELSVISGRNILKNMLNFFNDPESKYANVPFHIMGEYVAACQFDKYNFIRYKKYENPNESNTDENLKIIEYLPLVCECFLRHVLDIITLNPLHEVIEAYNNSNEANKEIPNEKFKWKDENTLCNIILANDKLTDKVNLAQRAKLSHLFDKSFDILCEVCESCELVNESIDVLNFKVEEKLKELWFIPGKIYKKVKKSLRTKSYLLENFWPQDNDEMSEHDLKITPFLFPQTLGNLAKKESNWRLEIVKFCMFLLQNDKILNLENDNSCEAFDEKRHELFEMVGESEYSKINAEWKSPCHELILKDICCSNCAYVHNMDAITSLIEAEINGKPCYIWMCKNCDTRYDNEFIELKILTLLQETFDAYNAQDLVCMSCKAIKSFHRRATCKCGKVFTPRLDINNWVKTLDIVQNLANMLNMNLLIDVIKSMRTHLR